MDGRDFTVPEFPNGFFVGPTLFDNVKPDMTIAKEEIFGPVLSILPYDDEDEAVRIANDTPYGLSGYVSCADLDKARDIAARLRTGMVHINGAWLDSAAPFGGYKQSGNGREWGPHGIEEFLEVNDLRSLVHYADAMSDQEILDAFRNGGFQPGLRPELGAFLEAVGEPLASHSRASQLSRGGLPKWALM